MALGGGTFIAQNKTLPGAYINFVSLANANATLSDRGIATMPLEFTAGGMGKVYEVTKADFLKNSKSIFGYDYTAPELKGLRDLFKNIHTLYAYNLKRSGGAKATVTGSVSEFATCLAEGSLGNKVSLVIASNGNKYDVSTKYDGNIIDTCTVTHNGVGFVDNAFVKFETGSFEYGGFVMSNVEDGEYPFEGGTDGTITGTAYQNYLDAIESYSFNAMGVAVTDDTTKSLFVEFTKRMREEMGCKFQLVIYNKAADYEGVVNVKNSADLVPWVTGVIAGCPINKSNLNRIYDGEYVVNTDYTQKELEDAIKAGEFTFHRVGKDVRVLEDVNSLVTVTDDHGEIFKDNQTIRTIDQIANDIAVLFNEKYLGKTPNDDAGRIALWADIVKHHEQLQDIRAIENFSDKDVVVLPGDTKKSVVVEDAVTIVNTMAKLYMTVTIQ